MGHFNVLITYSEVFVCVLDTKLGLSFGWIVSPIGVFFRTPPLLVSAKVSHVGTILSFHHISNTDAQIRMKGCVRRARLLYPLTNVSLACTLDGL